MSAPPRILTVLLNYRTAEMTLRAAEAALTAMAGLDADLVIVDNASGDGSVEAMQAHVAARGWPVRIIASARNGGFGAGNNIGIRAGMADGGAPDYLYILNSDAFPRPDALGRLVARLEAHPEAGIAGSYIEGEDGAPHVTAFRFPTPWSELEGAARFGPVSRALARHRVPLEIPAESQRVDWLAGASMLLRQRMLDQIGLFDETFFLYFEETDLCRRAARAGFETHYVRDSVVVHIGSVSTGMKRWRRIPGFWLDSRWHYFNKAFGRGGAILATLAHVAGGLIWRLRRLVQGKPAADPPHFLRDLIAHDARALFSTAPRQPDPAPGCGQDVKG